MEGAVIPEAREGVGLRLQLETRPDVGVVEREGGRVAEPDREPELFLRELLQADAVDVEGTLDPPACDQRDGDQRLRIGRRALDEPHPRVEVGAVCQHGLLVLDGPAGDPLSEAERLVGEHFVRIVAPGKHAAELASGLVRFVEGEIVVRNQLTDRVGDPLEQGVERLLREHVMEHVGETAVRLDERA